LNLQIEILDLKFQNELLLTIFLDLIFLNIKDYSIELIAHDLNFNVFLNLRFIFLNYCFLALKANNHTTSLIVDLSRNNHYTFLI